MARKMDKGWLAGIILLCCICWSFSACQSSNAQAYAIGADLSFMKQAEESGFIFKEAGEPKACLDIFRDHGYNWIRLRLFHAHLELPNNLEYTIELALYEYTRTTMIAFRGAGAYPDMVQIGNEISTGMLWPDGKLPDNRVVLNVPDNRGRGVFWWEPAVSRRGTRSFFDEEGNVLPVIQVYDKYSRR